MLLIQALIFEFNQSCSPRATGMVSVAYSCGMCEAFFAHGATVESVAKLLTN